MIHIESDNGKIFVKAEGSVENIVNDIINSMDHLVEELTKDDADEQGTIIAAFIVTALAKMWGSQRKDSSMWQRLRQRHCKWAKGSLRRIPKNRQKSMRG